MTCSLFVLNGPAPGKSLRLDPAAPVVTLGRHASSDLQLDDDRASRLHARLRFHSGAWRLEDADSRNGTLVNSQPVSRKTLERGDLIRIGERLILFVDEGGATSSFDPAQFHSTTLVGQKPMDSQWGRVVEQTLTGPVSRVVRDSAMLCHFAGELHGCKNTGAMSSTIVQTLSEAIDAGQITVWLLGADGRLQIAAVLPVDRTDGDQSAASQTDSDQTARDRALANLALEKNKAILCGPPGEDGSATVGPRPASIGTALCVPIPGRRRGQGAIECHAREKRPPFERSDLDFVSVVAHQVGMALENLSHRERIEQANQQLRRRVSDQTPLIGGSSAMRHVLDQIARVGPTGSNVLILGESGAGKELVARSLHEVSPRGEGPYVTVNCAAPSESLLESELFGHEAGAFTGADRRRIGHFERAHHGTMFLDEIGEMSPSCQAKLLRVLEGHPFERVGGQESIRVDARIIAATHRDLDKLVRDGSFREDLLYRLRVVDIQVPPLRDRGEDIMELATLFLEQFSAQMGRGPIRLSFEARDALRQYKWPGNVRQLRNAIERAVVLGASDEVAVDDLGIATPAAPPAGAGRMISLKEAERRHIQFVLQNVKGNKTAACRILSIGRATLYAKLADSADTDDSKDRNDGNETDEGNESESAAGAPNLDSMESKDTASRDIASQTRDRTSTISTAPISHGSSLGP